MRNKITTWSVKYMQCIVCSTTNAKHHGRGVCHTCYTKVLKAKNPQYRLDSNERTRKWNKKIRLMALQAYSARDPFCACCGESKIWFLTIDHINNDGAEHRKITKGSGSHTYVWLFKNNYPKGFQVLCFNCNHAKEIYGLCPHQMTVEFREVDESKITPNTV